jgi:hypothetical protein
MEFGEGYINYGRRKQNINPMMQVQNLTSTLDNTLTARKNCGI